MKTNQAGTRMLSVGMENIPKGFDLCKMGGQVLKGNSVFKQV